MGWDVAHLGRPDRSTRLWCLIASVAPDLDAFGILFGRHNYERYHHVLFHNLAFGVAVTLLSARWVGWRVAPLALVFAAFLSHLVGDYFGSGPGWGISPYVPFASVEYPNPSSWELFSWQNITITACAIALVLVIAERRGYTPLECVHAGVERAVVSAIALRARATPCARCAARAVSQCTDCGAALCATHEPTGSLLAPRCAACAPGAASSP